MYELLMNVCFFWCSCVYLDQIMSSEQVRRELSGLLGVKKCLFGEQTVFVGSLK